MSHATHPLLAAILDQWAAAPTAPAPRRDDRCPYCDGTGSRVIGRDSYGEEREDVCHFCNGSGYMKGE